MFPRDSYADLMPTIDLVETEQARFLGALLYEVIQPRAVIDWGCASGLYLVPFRERGCQVYGIDAEPRAGALLDAETFERRDVRFRINAGRHDLALCIEVAEHVQSEYAETLVANVADSAAVVFWSAAHPGQGGAYHWNEQPKEYWLNLFHAHGFTLHPDHARVMEQIRENPECRKVQWLLDNTLLLHKAERTVEMSKVVLYSAMTGGYDTLKELPDVGCDAVLFTEEAAQVKGWQNRVVRRKEHHPRMRAKWFKLHPHLLFPEYDISIWLDSSAQVLKRAFVREMVTYLQDAPLVFFPHRWRNNILDEAAATMALPKYLGLPLSAQVQSYYNAGYADECGLLECTSLLRRHNDPFAARFGEAWWDENLHWTYADQISAPFVLWRDKIPFARFPFDLSGQQWFQIATWRDDR